MRFKYCHCCVSVIIRTSGYFISLHLALGAFVFETLLCLAQFETLLGLGVCHLSRIPSLLNCYSTGHLRSLMFLKL